MVVITRTAPNRPRIHWYPLSSCAVVSVPILYAIPVAMASNTRLPPDPTMLT